jgi:hypothetical protein
MRFQNLSFFHENPVLEIIAGSKKQQVPALLSHLLGPVTSAVVRPPVAIKTRDDAMDEEGERASWLLLLSRAFARCFVRASDASARAKSDCSPDSGR